MVMRMLQHPAPTTPPPPATLASEGSAEGTNQSATTASAPAPPPPPPLPTLLPVDLMDAAAPVFEAEEAPAFAAFARSFEAGAAARIPQGYRPVPAADIRAVEQRAQADEDRYFADTRRAHQEARAEDDFYAVESRGARQDAQDEFAQRAADLLYDSSTTQDPLRRSGAPTEWRSQELTQRGARGPNPFKQIERLASSKNWVTDLDASKVSIWLKTQRLRLVGHDARLKEVYEMDKDEWWHAISIGDVRSVWLQKADNWVANQLIDHMDQESKDVINFMSVDDVNLSSGRVLLVHIAALYSITSGQALRDAEEEFAACDPLKMNMKQTDALFAINELKNLYKRLPSSSKRGNGNVQLILLKKLPDAYQWKRAQMDKYYEGDNKGVPTWENEELIKNICHWLKSDETRPAVYAAEARDFALSLPCATL